MAAGKLASAFGLELLQLKRTAGGEGARRPGTAAAAAGADGPGEKPYTPPQVTLLHRGDQYWLSASGCSSLACVHFIHGLPHALVNLSHASFTCLSQRSSSVCRGRWYSSCCRSHTDVCITELVAQGTAEKVRCWASLVGESYITQGRRLPGSCGHGKHARFGGITMRSVGRSATNLFVTGAYTCSSLLWLMLSSSCHQLWTKGEMYQLPH